MSASADTLTNSSRVFYERTRSKIVMSIVMGAGATYLLGYCAAAGGESSYNDYMMETQTDDKMESAYSALASGYGFASFCYILAFILAVAASVYYSPLFCGTDKERRMIKSPEEVGDGYAMYNDK